MYLHMIQSPAWVTHLPPLLDGQAIRTTWTGTSPIEELGRPPTCVHSEPDKSLCSFEFWNHLLIIQFVSFNIKSQVPQNSYNLLMLNGHIKLSLSQGPFVKFWVEIHLLHFSTSPLVLFPPVSKLLFQGKVSIRYYPDLHSYCVN